MNKRFLHFISRLSAVLLIGAALQACSDDSEYSTDYQCYFRFDTQIHNTSVITRAINPATPGIFVYVYSNPSGGVRHIYSELNDGQTKGDDAITTAKETSLNYMLGVNNGLIIGYSNLGNGLYAFDRQCPNCIKDFSSYKYPLSWTNNGNWVECTRCSRKYDLNNGGFVVEGEGGSKLIRYHAGYNGSLLSVN